jgi:glycosyltransferase involved in cell wall biosynthesis
MHHQLAVAVAVIIVLGAVVTCAELIRGYRATPLLEAQQPLAGSEPRVSIIVAARNEAGEIAKAMRSLLDQRYGNYEVVAVDDRSTDGTGAILDALAHDEPRLRVMHIDALPAGWIGKNYALFCGAADVQSPFLLFTDADVVFETTALSRAVNYMEASGLDHLTAGPDLLLRTIPLALVVNFFIMGFSLFMRPWKASDPRSRRHMGIGAFNLVRADAYRAAGTHERIAMRPDDDIKLGKALKQSGARQQVVSARNLLSVAWYDSLASMVRGMRKNGFAGFEYSVPYLIGATAVGLLLNVWPFVAVWVTSGATRWCYAVTATILIVMYAFSAAQQRTRPWLAPAYPIAALIFLYILWSSAIVTLVNNGISWRDTHYPLSALRRNRV